MTRGLRGVCLATLAVSGAGCAGVDIRSAPPVAVLTVWDAAGGVHAGHGVWINDRVLTALHVLIEDEHPIPDSLVINGEPSSFRLEASGDREQLRAVHPEGAGNYLLNRREDWAVVRLESVALKGRPRVRPGDGSVRPGESLYMTGYDLKAGSRRLEAIRVRVPRKLSADVPIPSGVIFVRMPEIMSGPEEIQGWSGSFVGRYDERRDEWEFVGIAAEVYRDAERPTTYYLALVRPPEAIVHRFFEHESQGDGAAPCVETRHEVPEECAGHA